MCQRRQRDGGNSEDCLEQGSSMSPPKQANRGSWRCGRKRVSLLLAAAGVAVIIGAWFTVRHIQWKIQENLLYCFEAKGVVASFEQDELNGQFSLWISAGETPYSGASYGVRSLALRYAPRELKPGVRFEKKYGSRKCLIDGREFDLYCREPGRDQKNRHWGQSFISH